jgi:hypothetical protein
MNNCIFTTHATLTEHHATMSLKSLFTQTIPFVWDNFIIYNTHPETISNEWLVTVVSELANGAVENIFVFPYEDGAYPKTLTQDTINHLQMLVDNELNRPGKTLLLKSDYCVSTNFCEVFQDIPNVNTIWSLPIYNAKEKVSHDLVLQKLQQDTFVVSDAVTYYRGGTNDGITPGTLDNPYDEIGPYAGMDETDPRILFVSHNIQNDYNLHVFSNDILNTCLQICKNVYNLHSTWGGAHDLFNVAFKFAGVEKNATVTAYGVHMYHGIISPNRQQDRTDHRKVIPGERY